MQQRRCGVARCSTLRQVTRQHTGMKIWMYPTLESSGELNCWPHRPSSHVSLVHLPRGDSLPRSAVSTQPKTTDMASSHAFTFDEGFSNSDGY